MNAEIRFCSNILRISKCPPYSSPPENKVLLQAVLLHKKMEQLSIHSVC